METGKKAVFQGIANFGLLWEDSSLLVEERAAREQREDVKLE